MLHAAVIRQWWCSPQGWNPLCNLEYQKGSILVHNHTGNLFCKALKLTGSFESLHTGDHCANRYLVLSWNSHFWPLSYHYGKTEILKHKMSSSSHWGTNLRKPNGALGLLPVFDLCSECFETVLQGTILHHPQSWILCFWSFLSSD